MARAKSKGFTPENLMAGIDGEIFPDEVQSEIVENTEEIEKKDKKVDVENTMKYEETEQQISSSATSLSSLVGEEKEEQKPQTNIYLPLDLTVTTDCVGKLVGKQNGGKSAVVEAALTEYFKKNSDLVKKALDLYEAEIINLPRYRNFKK